MIKAVLYDVGGVLHIPFYDDALCKKFTDETLAFLDQNDVRLGLCQEQLEVLIADGTKRYKAWADERNIELPVYDVWRDFILKDYGVADEKIAEIAEELSYRFNNRRRRDMRPHLMETIKALHTMGVRQGVISNVISTTFIPRVISEYGLDPYMECIVQSSVEGVRKPDRKLFDIAVARMGGLKNAECAYIGDTISRDIIGAKNAEFGLTVQIVNPTTVYRDGKYKNTAFAPDRTIEDLAELPALIAAYR